MNVIIGNRWMHLHFTAHNVGMLCQVSICLRFYHNLVCHSGIIVAIVQIISHSSLTFSQGSGIHQDRQRAVIRDDLVPLLDVVLSGSSSKVSGN